MSPRPDAHLPGPQGPEMLRNIGLMRRDPPRFLAQCAERYGPVVAFPIPRTTVVYLADPTDVRHVLQGNHRAYGKRTVQYDALATITGHGLLTSDGDLWRRMRRVQQPAFHRDQVKTMADDVQRAVGQLVDSWSRSPPDTALDLDQEMLELTMGLVGSTLFGGDLGREAPALVDAVTQALHIVVARAQLPVTAPDWLPTRSRGRFSRALDRLDLAVARLIDARRREPLGSDVLSLLLSAQDEGVATPDEVRNEVVTLIVAGHETVAATLTWTWSLLASHADAERCLHAEVDALSPGPWKASVLGELPYTRAVVDECLRLYPPAWVITRRSLEPDTLGGYEVPVGSTVIMSPYLLHRDTAWWEAPDRFDPVRFFGSAVSVDRALYGPFGAGPRLCIGRELALFETPLIVAALARQFRIRPTQPQLASKDFGVTLRPKDGLPALVSLRQGTC